MQIRRATQRPLFWRGTINFIHSGALLLLLLLLQSTSVSGAPFLNFRFLGFVQFHLVSRLPISCNPEFLQLSLTKETAGRHTLT